MKVKGGRGGRVELQLDEDDAGLLRSLVGEMLMLLEADVPDVDPVKRRLFPDAYDDPENERSFRELTGDDLQSAKREAVVAVRDTLGTAGPVDVDLGPDDVGTWLRLLTDLRLAIGVRLEVTEETMAAEIDPNDRNAGALSVLHWLGWVQGSILERIGG